MKQISLLDDREWPTEGFSFTLPIRPESTALVAVSYTHLLAHETSLQLV